MKALITICIAVTMLAIACKKHPEPIKPQPVKPKPVFSVSLNNDYLRGHQVDSAFASWDVNGQQQRIKFDVRNDSLIALMESFNEGSGKMTIQVFSNKKYSNQYYSEWLSKKEMTLEKTTNTHFAGPVSFFDSSWVPRVELKDAIGHRAIMGLRPDDPYFLIVGLQPQVVKLTVAKAYWKGIQSPAHIEWKCYSNCTNQNGDVENNTAFKSLPLLLGTKEWNHIELYVLYAINIRGEGYVLSLQYEP